jgi:hypothetical protein
MRAAASLLLLCGVLAACAEGSLETEANNAAVTEIEALPPDESVATPTDELANGAVEPAAANNSQD